MLSNDERSKNAMEKFAELKAFDEEMRKDCKYLIGVDEVGRGPLAGPVVACALIMPEDCEIIQINDSKKLSAKVRKEAFEYIKDQALAFGLGFVNNRQIDKFNIRNATKMAMEIAVKKCRTNFNQGEDEDFKILIDGNMKIVTDLRQEVILQGDSKSLSVAAASIVAKVSRDEFMREYGKKYPEFNFEKHKGYGTKAHYDAIDTFGMTPIHRKSFLKKVLDKMEEEIL